jgi:hypothetical protein
MLNLKLVQKVVLVVFSFFVSFTPVYAATLEISKPSNNQRLTGEVEVRWSVFNTNTQNAPYDLSILDATCSSGFSIAGANFTQTVKNGYYTTKFNSRTGSDGRKCLRLCVFDTSQCTYRTIEVVNNSNQAPIITNYPSKLTFNTNEVFRHVVEYYDPENDPSMLVLLQAPNFIVLEQNGLNTIGQYFVPGEYLVNFMAIDDLGAASQQSFTISVLAAPTPIPVPTGGPTPVPTPTISPIERSFAVVSPKGGVKLSGIENRVEWDYGSISKDSFGRINLSYSAKDKQEFKEIYTTDDYTIDEYKWDVSIIEPGEYLLKFEIFDESGKLLVEEKSEGFVVEQTTGQDPIIVEGFVPPNNSKVENRRPEISANYRPSDGAKVEIDKVKIVLDKRNISSTCSINESGFKCSLDKDLSVGSHRVEVNVVDSNKQETTQAWSFEIIDSSEPNDDEDKVNPFTDFFNNFNFQGENLTYLYLCCGILLILALFIFVIRTLGQKKSSYDKEISSFNSTNDFTTSPDPSFDSSELENEPYDFSVGKYDVVAESEPVSSVPPIQSSSSTEIPDWLKGDESYGANPVDSSGSLVDMKGQDSASSINDQSQVHESFDLAKANYGDEDSK